MKPDIKIEIKLLENGKLHVMLDDLRPSYYEGWNRELTVEQFFNDLKKYIEIADNGIDVHHEWCEKARIL